EHAQRGGIRIGREGMLLLGHGGRPGLGRDAPWHRDGQALPGPPYVGDDRDRPGRIKPARAEIASRFYLPQRERLGPANPERELVDRGGRWPARTRGDHGESVD